MPGSLGNRIVAKRTRHNFFPVFPPDQAFIDDQLLRQELNVPGSFYLCTALLQVRNYIRHTLNFSCQIRNIIFGNRVTDLKFCTIPRIFYQVFKGVSANMTDIFIRILAFRHIQHPDRKPCLFGNTDCPYRIAPSRVVAVIGKHNILCNTVKQFRMLLAKRSPQGSYDPVNSGCMKADGIHVAFHDNRFLRFTNRLEGHIQAKQGLPFLKDIGFTRIQILWQTVVHHAASKCNHFSPRVLDRDHHPVDKKVAVMTVLIPYQPCSGKLFRRTAFFNHVRLQRIKRRLGKAQGETFNNRIGNPSVMKIFQRCLAGFCFVQARRKVTTGQIVNPVHLFSFFFPAHISRRPVRFGDWDIGTSSQRLDRFREGAVLYFLYKGEYISAGMTAVTVKKLSFLIHTE